MHARLLASCSFIIWNNPARQRFSGQRLMVLSPVQKPKNSVHISHVVLVFVAFITLICFCYCLFVCMFFRKRSFIFPALKHVFNLPTLTYVQDSQSRFHTYSHFLFIHTFTNNTRPPSFTSRSSLLRRTHASISVQPFHLFMLSFDSPYKSPQITLK